MSDLKQAALSYASKGIPVFPCQPNAKIPFAGGHGCKDATTDLELVEEWWTKAPDANVAIATGNGRIVIDIDTKNGSDGWGSLDALMYEHGELPGTRAAQTPSGGAHLYYLVADETVRNSAGKLGAGLDVRGDGGYVLAPPSLVDGKPYAWTSQAPTAMLPDQWLELLEDKWEPITPVSCPSIPANRSARCAYLRAALEDERTTLLNAIEGTRHDTLNRYGFSLGRLVHLGLKPADIIASAEWVFGQWVWTHKRPDMRKARMTLERAIRDGAQHPREVANV